MKTKVKPIVSWSIWAGGLSLIMGIVTHKHLVAGFKADETGMTNIIAALFCAGLIVSFLAAKKLHSEWDILAKIKQTHKIPVSKGEQSIAGVFKILDDLKTKGETANVHTSIDTYHSKHNSRVRSVSIMAALVISMGLLGTVVGLIMSISGLGSMVENIGLSRNTMMVALKATVSGMGTAFYTTFFGALGGLILRAVAVAQLNSLSELCAEAAEYAENNLVSKIDDKNEELNKQVSKVIGSFKKMEQEIESITVSLSESFKSTMSSFGVSIADAGSHAMGATKECIDNMTDEMHVFSCEIGSSFETFNKTILKSGKGIDTAIGTINTSIEQSGEELNAAFGGLNEMIAKSGDGVVDAFEGVNGTIATAAEGVTESFDSLNGSVKQAGDTVAGSLADFKLSVDGTSLELNDAVGELHSAISQATGEMVTMAKARLDTEATEIAGHLSIAADSIQQYLQQKSVNKDESQKVA
ncbi:MAG: MotA/TolQ/ExbB proton channel family protein [Pontiella sp.]